jgi:hypothetical protein
MQIARAAIGIEQSRVLAHDRQIFVDQQTLINNVDFKVANSQPAVAKFELIRRSDYRRTTLRLEIFAKQLELFLGRHSLEIDYRDLRRPIRFADREIPGGNPAVLSTSTVALQVSAAGTFGKPFHHRQLLKNFVGRIRVSNSRRTLSVQFDKTVGFVGQK